MVGPRDVIKVMLESCSMKGEKSTNLFKTTFLLISLFGISLACNAQESNSQDAYTFKSGSRDGIGKWYMGREIAHVMGYQGISCLNRTEREREEKDPSGNRLLLMMIIWRAPSSRSRKEEKRKRGTRHEERDPFRRQRLFIQRLNSLA